MSTVNSIVSQLNEVLDSANTKMESSHTNVTDAVDALVEGYGQGGSANLDSIIVTPTGKEFVETPDDGYDGFSSVTVVGDTNLKPSNILAGVTIYGVTGNANPIKTPDEFLSENPDVPDPGTTEAADAKYRSVVGAEPPKDKMILVDADGNITYGYMDKPSVVATQFGSWDLYPLTKLEVDYEVRPSYLTIFLRDLSDYKQFWLYITNVQMTIDENYIVKPASTPYTKVEYYYKVPNGSDEWYMNNRNTSYTGNLPGIGEGSAYKLLYTNYPLYDANGNLYRKASERIDYSTGGFVITRYDKDTTEFAAKGWRRLSYHTTGEKAGTWSYDDFTNVASNGWNYFNNVRWSSCDKLSHRFLPVWPKVAQEMDTIAPDMTQWTKNSPATSAFTAISYDSITKENVCQYKGVGMFEYIGFSQKLQAGKTYMFVMDYCCKTVVTGDYAMPYAPYFGFFPTSVLSSDADAYLNAYSTRNLPLDAMTEYETFACTYTPGADIDVALAFGPGSTTDGVATEFYFKNIGLWELPEREYVQILDATPLLVRGGLHVEGSDGYVLDTTTNRLRVGKTESNDISIKIGTKITVELKTSNPSNWAMWFINSSGANKIASGGNLTKGTHYIDTGWMYSGQICEVPEDTQYIWLNFRRQDNADVTLDELESYVIYKVVDYV